jgi:hypothetical protein
MRAFLKVCHDWYLCFVDNPLVACGRQVVSVPSRKLYRGGLYAPMCRGVGTQLQAGGQSATHESPIAQPKTRTEVAA